jgi:hypothetical protein
MALAIARAIQGAKKVAGPSKSLDFVPGPHRVGRVLSVSPVVGIGTPPPL